MEHTHSQQQQIKQQQVDLYAGKRVTIQHPPTVSIQKNSIYFLKLINLIRLIRLIKITELKTLVS